VKTIVKILRLIKNVLRKIQDFIATEPVKEEIPEELYKKWSKQLKKGTAPKFIKEGETKKFSLRELWEDYRKDKS